MDNLLDDLEQEEKSCDSGTQLRRHRRLGAGVGRSAAAATPSSGAAATASVAGRRQLSMDSKKLSVSSKNLTGLSKPSHTEEDSSNI